MPVGRGGHLALLSSPTGRRVVGLLLQASPASLQQPKATWLSGECVGQLVPVSAGLSICLCFCSQRASENTFVGSSLVV